MYLLRRLFNPEIFQGMGKKQNYFEGWYFKCVDERTKQVLAVIPGISLGASPQKSHAFVQVIDGARNRSGFFTYPIEAFKASARTMSFSIGKNSFSQDGLTLELKDERMSYLGSLKFHHTRPYPKTLGHPGIMGPFSFLPFMECYHGVVHMEHTLSGHLFIDGALMDFTRGRGYIEKDWGTSFPEAWIWVQCNHFNQPDISFMLSYARIPFLGGSFSGLIAFLNTPRQFYRLTTYQGARVKSLNYQDHSLVLLAESKHLALNLSVFISGGSRLLAPKKGTMTTPLVESLISSLKIMLRDKRGTILFEGEGHVVGVEVSDNFTLLK